MDKSSKILILGANGLVGSAIVDNLKKYGYFNLLTPRSFTCNLRNKNDVFDYFCEETPEYVIFSAAKVGGIQSNISNPVDFGIENTEMINNVFQAAYANKIKKMLFLGSSCIYPKNSPQPIKEEYLLSGQYEKTNEMYALAKTYGIKLCEAYKRQFGCNFISGQPCNIYGPKDNFDPINGHVVASLIFKIYNAVKHNNPEIECWGDGSSRREILFSDDLGDACIFLMNNYDDCESHINIGYGYDISIKELVEKICKIFNYTGKIIWNTDKPSGMKQKLLDVSKINNLGWKYKTDIDDGLNKTINWFLKNKKD